MGAEMFAPSPLPSCSFCLMSVSRLTVRTSWTQLDGPLAGAVCVIDVLRWTSCVVTALNNGAQRIEAFAEPEQALERQRALGDKALAVGERHAHKLPGFALGNSLRDYGVDAVRGKILCSTTTNGTRALLAAADAEWVLLGSYLNFGATAGALASLLSRGLPVTLLGAGNDGDEALEDTTCAGAFVDWLVAAPLLRERELDKSARRAREMWIEHKRSPALAIAAAPHANALVRAGYEHDLHDAAQLNTTALVAVARGNVVERATQLVSPP